MVIKQIKVYTKSGQLNEYLAAQDVWNRETRRAPGYLGCHCGRDPAEPSVVHLHLFWRSRGDLERWMAEDHDRIAAMAGADAHYERIEVYVIDGLSSSSTVPLNELAERTRETRDIQILSELYRVSAALRIAVRLGLFDKLGGEPTSVGSLAEKLSVDAEMLKRLLLVMCSMGLASRSETGWRNTPLAERTLVEGAAAFQGNMVLHNTQREYVSRVFAFSERLGLNREAEGEAAYRPRFIRAMAETAAGGQAEALLASVNLTGCATMLDVGGATGSYSVALCRAYPKLRALILDLPSTVPLAKEALEQADLGDRVQVKAHDYRIGPLPGAVDAVLISNILRGETRETIRDILKRVYEALAPGGRLFVVDCFVSDPPAVPDLRATLFGLHLPDGANLSLAEMADAVVSAGFDLKRSEHFPRPVVMNGIVEGWRPGELEGLNVAYVASSAPNDQVLDQRNRDGRNK